MVWDKSKGMTGFVVLSVLFLVAFLHLFTRWGVNDAVPEMVGFWIVCLGSVLVLFSFRHGAGGMQCAVLYTGYLLRCAVMLVDIYGRSFVTLVHSGADSEGFAGHAAALYKETMTEGVLTKYPYIINWIYHVTGENRLCAQYVNVLFWVLSVWVLIRICDRYQVEEKKKIVTYAVWALLPTGVLLSGILLRESMEAFFGMWSFERFLCWMEDGRWKHCFQAFACVIPAMVLHSASVALWVAYVFIVMFWDPKQKRYRWQMKSMAVLVCAVAGIACIFSTPLRQWLFAYFGSNFSLYAITHKVFDPGQSDYLVELDCQSWLQFVPYTLLRMFYFLFSPLPTEARGMKDIVAFLADGFVLGVVLCRTVVNLRRKREQRGYARAAMLGGFSFAGIFAWGVRNAGSALRHRYLAWSIFLIALAISYGHSGTEEMKEVQS